MRYIRVFVDVVSFHFYNEPLKSVFLFPNYGWRISLEELRKLTKVIGKGKSPPKLFLKVFFPFVTLKIVYVL